MRKTPILFLSLALILLPLSANAGFAGTKCSNSGATISKAGVNYTCKKIGGKLKWQKPPALTEAQKGKAWTDCVVSRVGNAGFSNDDLINASQYCRKKLGFGY